MKAITYPFKAKSTSYLQPGQFWAVSLHQPGYFDYPGWYGCGRVLEIVQGSKRDFLAGLMDWVDTKAPTAETIAGAKIIDQTIVHIRGISSDILGWRSLEADGLGPLMWLGQSGGNYSNPNKRPDLMRGLVVLREATVAEYEKLSKKDLVRSWGGVGVGYRTKAFFETCIAKRVRESV